MNKDNQHWTEKYPLIAKGLKMYMPKGVNEEPNKVTYDGNKLFFKDGSMEISLHVAMCLDADKFKDKKGIIELKNPYSMWVFLLNNLELSELKIID